MIVLYILLFFISVLALVKSGAVAVRKLVAISRYLRISEYVLAFILMALATSLPEFFCRDKFGSVKDADSFFGKCNWFKHS